MLAFAQTQALPTTQMVITMADHTLPGARALQREQVSISQPTGPVEVTGWIPLVGENAGLDLFVVVDEASNYQAGRNFESLRRFIRSQPPSTAIGLAYIHEGALQVVEEPTRDHERVALALRDPAGSQVANPYSAVTELIRRWPQNALRREVLLVSDGIDSSVTGNFGNEHADALIEEAQRAGVLLYILYHPRVDYLTRDLWQIQAGQVSLGHISYETGGEAYFMGFGPLRSFEPFLSDIAGHLTHQYLVKFTARPCRTPGLQPVTVKTSVPDAELMAPDKVWIGSPARLPGAPVTLLNPVR
jgi:hypothetical protein